MASSVSDRDRSQVIFNRYRVIKSSVWGYTNNILCLFNPDQTHCIFYYSDFFFLQWRKILFSFQIQNDLWYQSSAQEMFIKIISRADTWVNVSEYVKNSCSHREVATDEANIKIMSSALTSYVLSIHIQYVHKSCQKTLASMRSEKNKNKKI